jgi:hypothetical protein
MYTLSSLTDRQTVIFPITLCRFEARFRGRRRVVHHLDPATLSTAVDHMAKRSFGAISDVGSAAAPVGYIDLEVIRAFLGFEDVRPEGIDRQRMVANCK